MLVCVGYRFEPDEQLDTLLQFDPVLLAVSQAVEELVGRKPRGVAILLTVCQKFLGGPGEQQTV